jgi:UDP-galactopyranose mutase
VQCYDIDDYVLWYYTPMALDASRHLTSSRAVVYDRMDELSACRGAPPDLIVREAELLCSATLVHGRKRGGSHARAG